ncbi:MAG TPA: hypothetical protein VIG85_02350 [Comamonas sp.]
MGIKHWFTLATTAALACGSAMAQEQARVLSAIPVVQQVQVPQQFCQDEQVYSGQRTNGTGAIIGAVIGGVAGNALGRSSGRHADPRAYRGYHGHRGYGYRHHGYSGGSNQGAATIIGAIAGGLIGNVIESSNSQPQYETVQRCTQEMGYENHTVGYDVTYEYAGQRYTTRMDQHPGAWMPIQLQPQQPHFNATPTDTGRFVGPSGVYQPAPSGRVVVQNINYAPANSDHVVVGSYPPPPREPGYWR